MTCPECGAEIAEDSVVCAMCGYPVQEAADQRDTAPTRPSAAAEQSEKTVAVNTGARLTVSAPEASATPSYDEILQQVKIKQEKARKKRIIIIVIIAAVLIVAGGIIAVISVSGRHSSSGSSSSSSSSGSSYSSSSSYEMSHSTYCMLYMRISNVSVTHSRNYTYISGTITNTGNYQIKYVKVKAACKNKSGTVIDTDWTYAVDSSWLEPGESNQFEMMVKDESNQIKSADVSVVYE